MEKQAQRIIENFQEYVLKKQYQVAYKEKIQFVLTTIGSFFNDLELPFEYKRRIINKLLLKIKKLRLAKQIFLYIEVRPEDVIEYEYTGKFNKISTELANLNTTLLLGLESIDDFVRNNLYLKNLNKETFERAVKIIREHELSVGAFVFVGAMLLSQNEILNDFKATITYLYSNDIIPVIMIGNVKPCTLYHLLFMYRKYKLVEPRTILRLLTMLKERERELSPVPWLIADPVGGPPEPSVHPFDNDFMVTCKECSYAILTAIRLLRKTYNWDAINHIIVPEVKECICESRYTRLISEEKELERIPLSKRLENTITFIESKIEKYIRCLVNSNSKYGKQVTHNL